MVIGEFLRKLQENLRKEQELIKDHMGSGGCSDFIEYSRNVGTIAGLEQSITTIDETIRNLNEEDQE